MGMTRFALSATGRLDWVGGSSKLIPEDPVLFSSKENVAQTRADGGIGGHIGKRLLNDLIWSARGEKSQMVADLLV